MGRKRRIKAENKRQGLDFETLLANLMPPKEDDDDGAEDREWEAFVTHEDQGRPLR